MITQIEFLRELRRFINELIELDERKPAPERVTFDPSGFAQQPEAKARNTMAASIVGPTIAGPYPFTQPFRLLGNVPQGQTFVEPTVKQGVNNVASWTSTLNASATAPTDGSNPVSPIPPGYVGPFSTTGVIIVDGVTLGAYDIEADVLGVDDADCTGEVLAVPGPETVGFDPNGFTAGT